MIVQPLPGRSTGAIRDVLLSHGWEGVLATETAAALEPWAYHFAALDDAQVEALLQAAPRYGLELLTGADWAILTGSRSRLSAMARSWHLPEVLREVAVSIGRGLPADAPDSWLVGTGPVALGDSTVVLGVDVPEAAFVTCDAADAMLGARLQQSAAGSLGVLLVASDPHAAHQELAGAMDAVLAAGLEPERVALDPGWVPTAPDLATFRAFGRPLACRVDDAVTAVLAWERGTRIFRTANPAMVREAIARAQALGA